MDRAPRGEPEKSVLPMADGRVRLSCTWKADPEQVEMIEEWQIQPQRPQEARAAAGRQALCLHRKWRRTDRLKGSASPWSIEIGSPPPAAAALAALGKGGKGEGSGVVGKGGKGEGGGKGQGRVLVAEAAGNPVWHARDATHYWEFLVTDIPYPIATYSVTVDAEAQQLVLRTANKKYFRRWSVDALRRRGVALDAGALQVAHDGGSVLCIRYRKPAAEVEAEGLREKELLDMLRGNQFSKGAGGDKAAPDCKTS